MIVCNSESEYLDLVVSIRDYAVNKALKSTYKDLVDLGASLDINHFSSTDEFIKYFLMLLSSNYTLFTDSRVVRNILKNPSIFNNSDSFASFVRVYLEDININNLLDGSFNVLTDYYNINAPSSGCIYIPNSIYNLALNFEIDKFNTYHKELEKVFMYIKEVLEV